MSVNEFETDQPISPGLPSPWTWLACALILLLGAIGFIRGLGDSKPIDAILAPVKGLPAVATLTAAEAAPLPHNDDWSVLSGPKILPPPVPKPVKAAPSKDLDDSDDAPAPATPAAHVDAQAPDNTPPPAVKPTATPPSAPSPPQ